MQEKKNWSNSRKTWLNASLSTTNSAWMARDRTQVPVVKCQWLTTSHGTASEVTAAQVHKHNQMCHQNHHVVKV